MMGKSQLLRKFTLLLLGTLLLLWLVPVLWDMQMERPYSEFLNNIEKAQPRLMLMNENILEQIQHPEGVVEEGRSQNIGVGSPVHAVTLYITYQLLNDLQAENVYSYYDAFLANDWSKIVYGNDTRLYYKQHTCVKINFFTSKTYRIMIWHDFLAQDFTPKPPPPWVMFYHELVYTDYQPCPPK